MRLLTASTGSEPYRTVPPSMRGTPLVRQKMPNTDVSSITRRSAHIASSNPPATLWPDTAAITGLLRNMRVGLVPGGEAPNIRVSTQVVQHIN